MLCFVQNHLLLHEEFNKRWYNLLRINPNFAMPTWESHIQVLRGKSSEILSFKIRSNHGHTCTLIFETLAHSRALVNQPPKENVSKQMVLHTTRKIDYIYSKRKFCTSDVQTLYWVASLLQHPHSKLKVKAC